MGYFYVFMFVVLYNVLFQGQCPYKWWAPLGRGGKHLMYYSLNCNLNKEKHWKRNIELEYHIIIEYPKLEGTSEDHWVQHCSLKSEIIQITTDKNKHLPWF